VTTFHVQSFSFHLVGLETISSSNLFTDLHTYIQTARKKDDVQGEISSLRPRPGADHIWGIVSAFHTLLPPIVIVNETETSENELKKWGIWSSGEKNASPGRAVATVELQGTVLRSFANVKDCEFEDQRAAGKR
jgi:hypothetical protein